MMMEYRLEHDVIGEMRVPKKAYYGINALRAHRNFTVTQRPVDPEIIKAMVEIKAAAAITNNRAKTLNRIHAYYIVQACRQILKNTPQAAAFIKSNFITPAIQGGAGTSTNMNTNEVVAHLATKLAHADGEKITIDSHNDVNQSQSTNDTYPTAGKIAMLSRLRALLKSIRDLILAFDKKAAEYKGALKIGRTQLQDAMPTTYGRTFKAFADTFKQDLKDLKEFAPYTVNMGGTAIGTGVNASKYYQHEIVPNLNRLLPDDIQLKQAKDLIAGTQNCNDYAKFSGALKTFAIDLAKMGNDFRLMASGPQAGLNELSLPKVQPGSSIMAGKINPVIPEALVQAAYETIGNDTTVSISAEHGELELNAFEPLIFSKILESEIHLANACEMFIKKCLVGTITNTELGEQEVETSSIAATVLNPIVGYDRVTKLVRKSLKTHHSAKDLAINEHLVTNKQAKKLFAAQNLVNPNV